MTVASDYRLVSTWRKVSLFGGLFSILLGLVLLLWPSKTVLVVAGLVGVWLLVLGATRIFDAATSGRHGPQPSRENSGRGFSALAGAMYFLAGVVILANLHESVKFVAVVLGLIWICAGLSEAIGGFARVGGTWVRTAAIATGVINVALGVAVLIWPKLSLNVLVWIAALWLILLGVVQLYFSALARKAERELRIRPQPVDK